MYQLEIRRSAGKYLSQIPKADQEVISRKIKNLSHDPFPQGYKKMASSKTPQYIIRVGRYRVVYRVNQRELLIVVVRIGYRKDIYN
ncbi:MAG: hypothetical protein IEMM0008_0441 [bacterium]|nr:MAG: hypothetical protein IEMM0008_0441 [bacterium]